ncbi:MAG: ATP12 family protein [Ahrensia sp.]
MRDELSDLHGDEKDPVKVSQRAMRKPLPKRFYTSVAVEEADGVFQVTLDGRIVKTPGRAPLQFQPQVFAERLAHEFDAQAEEINPATMPFYRLANTAFDGVATDLQAVREDIIRFSGSDLLCYRAAGPDGLVALQAQHWDEPLDWMAGLVGSRFVLAEGIMHVSQPKAATAGFGALVAQYDDPLAVSAFHVMTTLTGSAILAFGVMRGEMTAQEAWTAAHVDEDWNIAQWGEDAHAQALRASKWIDMDVAAFVAATLNPAT